MKKSKDHGKIISQIEVVDITKDNVVIKLENTKLCLSYDDFPWFKNKSSKAIKNVTEPTPNHYYWPELDIDLTYKIIKHPEKYECKSNI